MKKYTAKTLEDCLLEASKDFGVAPEEIIYKIEEENETFLEAAACPGPFSVDFTKPELFTKKRFSFDDEGRAAAVDWLNELYEEKREFFEDVYNHPDKYYKEHHKTDE